jgi:hypothetical protein
MNERPLDEYCDAPLRGTVDAFESSLIAAGKREGMGPAKKRALALALAGGAAAATMGACGTAKAATAGAAATKAKGAAGLAILKWIAAGIAGSALAVGATKGAIHVYETQRTPTATFTSGGTRGRAPTAPSVVAKPASPAAGPVSPSTSSAAALPDETPNPASAPVGTTSELPTLPAPPAMPAAVASPAGAHPSPRGHAATPSAHASSAPPKSDGAAEKPSALGDELKTIERARAALAANDTAAAARALDEHDRLFANGAFAEEARVLRIDLHAKKGDVARARSEARAYLSAHPGSPYAPRLRQLARAGEEGDAR